MQKLQLKLSSVILLLFFSITIATAQVGIKPDIVYTKTKNTEVLKSFQKKPKKIYFSSLNNYSLNQFGLNQKTSAIPNTFDANKLPLFCKIEWNIEKASKLPVKFRLGEVQQVEAKEGKMKHLLLKN